MQWRCAPLTGNLEGHKDLPISRQNTTKKTPTRNFGEQVSEVHMKRYIYWFSIYCQLIPSGNENGWRLDGHYKQCLVIFQGGPRVFWSDERDGGFGVQGNEYVIPIHQTLLSRETWRNPANIIEPPNTQIEGNGWYTVSLEALKLSISCGCLISCGSAVLEGFWWSTIGWYIWWNHPTRVLCARFCVVVLFTLTWVLAGRAAATRRIGVFESTYSVVSLLGP